MVATRSVKNYAEQMKRCGVWPIARMLRKQGYPIGYTKFVAQYSKLG